MPIEKPALVFAALAPIFRHEGLEARGLQIQAQSRVQIIGRLRGCPQLADCLPEFQPRLIGPLFNKRGAQRQRERERELLGIGDAPAIEATDPRAPVILPSLAAAPIGRDLFCCE